MDQSFFASLCTEIETSYDELGHNLGWRFLMGPQATLSNQTKIALITLNPGGAEEPPNCQRASCETGNAYFIEQWRNAPAGRSPLQVQVQNLLADLNSRLGKGCSSRQFADTKVLCAYYVPFRSPRFEDLPRKQESLLFAQKLWGRLLTQLELDFIVTIDRETFAAMEALLTSGGDNIKRQSFTSGWGKCSFEASRCYCTKGHMVTVARFPHLSTFKVFSRADCLPHIKTFLDYVTGA